MNTYTSILKSDSGYRDVSARFNVGGAMVGVDFNPVVTIHDKKLQEAIESDPMFGVNFDVFPEAESGGSEEVAGQGSTSTSTSTSATGGGVHGTVTTKSMKALNANSIAKKTGSNSKPSKNKKK